MAGEGEGLLAGALMGIPELIKNRYMVREKRRSESNQETLRMLTELSQSSNPKISNKALAGLIKFQRELETGKGKGKSKGSTILQDIFDPAFEEDEDYQRLLGTAAMLKQAEGRSGGGGGALPKSPPSVAPPEVPEEPMGQGGGGIDPRLMSPGQPVGSGTPMEGAPSMGSAPPVPSAPPSAATVEGTGQIQPAATLGSMASTIQPTSRPLSEDMAGLGFEPNALGSYGKQGDQLLGSVYAGRVSEKEATRRRADMAKAAAGYDFKASEGQKNRDAAMERTKTRTQSAWERLQEAERLRAQRPKSSGHKRGINYEKETLMAGTDYKDDLDDLNSQERREKNQAQMKAAELDWDPLMLQRTIQEIDSHYKQRREELAGQFRDRMQLMGVLAGGAQAAATPAAPRTPGPPKVGGGKTYKWGGRRGLTWDQLPPAGQAAARAAGQAPQ